MHRMNSVKNIEELRIIATRNERKIEDLPELRATVQQNTKKIKYNTGKIKEVDQDTKEMRKLFNSFVTKAEAAMNSQTSAAHGTKQQLELLTQQLGKGKIATRTTYEDKARNQITYSSEHKNEDEAPQEVNDLAPPRLRSPRLSHCAGEAPTTAV